MRLTCLLLILFCGYFVTAQVTPAEEESPQVTLSLSLERDLKKFDDAIHKAEQEYLEEVQKAQEKIRNTFDKEIESITKKGDLQGALALLEYRDRLLAQTVARDLLGNVIRPHIPIEKLLLNKSWGYFQPNSTAVHQTWQFKADGTVTGTNFGVAYNTTYIFENNVLTLTASNNKRYIRITGQWDYQNDKFILSNKHTLQPLP